MSNWKFTEQPDWYLTWPETPGIGKFWKRKLHKARRRAWKQGRYCRGEKYSMYRGQSALETTVNYRTH